MDRDEWEWDGSRSNLITQFELICSETYKVCDHKEVPFKRRLILMIPQISLGSTLFFAGYPLGSLFIGFIADYVGRKWLATAFLLLTGIFNCTSALLSSYSTFIVIRAVRD